MQFEFRPAAEHSGIVFVRSDLAKRVRIPALVANRIETPRRTTLKAEGATVEMIEHVLAALFGLGIDNCEVWVDQAELPGCDGSSQPFVECLDRAGIVEQKRRARPAHRARSHARGQRRELDRGPARDAQRACRCVIGSTTASATRSAGRRCNFRSRPSRFARAGLLPHVHAQDGGRLAARRKGLASERRSRTCWFSTTTDRSTTSCGSATSACATRCSTWSAIWRWPAATWSATLSPIAAAIG